MRSLLTFLVALYLALDIANPLMPGALVFGVEECVEVSQSLRFRDYSQATCNMYAPPRVEPIEPAVRLSRLPAAPPPVRPPHWNPPRLPLLERTPSAEDS